ncbi:MAG: DUF819 family protein [Bacteroidales bacterium]
MIFLLLLFYLFSPAVIILLTKKYSFLNKIGAVVLAYIVGIVLGNIGILPSISEQMRELLHDRAYFSSAQMDEYIRQGLLTAADILPNRLARFQDIMMSITIPLAIPLLLFTLDIKRWFRLAGRALLSMILGLAALVVVIVVGFFLLKENISAAWKVAGMLVGTYSGGTPNLAAIATALEVDPNIFILVNTYEIVVSFGFLVLLLSVAQSLLSRFLPKFKAISTQSTEQAEINSEEFDDKLSRSSFLEMAKAFGLSVAIFAISGGVSLLVPKSAQMVTVIIGITTLGVLGSLVPAVNRMKHSFSLGMYLILIFSLLVASMADLSVLLNIDFLHLFLFVALGVLGTMLIHVLLSWIFRIDVDTTIITITALSFSPPFVPVVASALKNKDIIISGLAVGTLGYIIGNYLGISLAYFLKGFG